MKVSIVTQPTEEPLTLDEAKHHLRIDTEDDDSLILSLTKASREYTETVTGRKLITQTWKYYLDDWPEDKNYIALPFPPLSSVTHLKYTDYNSVQVTVSTSSYDFDTVSEPGRIVLAHGECWPGATLHPTNPIEIQFVCGYGTPDDIPESLKPAMKIDLSDMYEQRESIVVGQPVAHLDILDRLYMPYRVFKF